MHERWQEYELAQEYYAKARQAAEQGGHLFEQSEPARHAALHVLRNGDLDQALAFAQQALGLREAASFRLYQPLDHLLLRDIYLAKGDTTRAQWHAEKASTLAEEMGLTTLVASMPNIRNVLTGQGERE